MTAVEIKTKIAIIETAKTALFKLQTYHKYGTLPSRPPLLGGVPYETPFPRGVWRYPLQEDALCRVKTEIATKPPAKQISRIMLVIASTGRWLRQQVKIALIRV
jgi:hypothetical protein